MTEFRHFQLKRRCGTRGETNTAENPFVKEPAVADLSQVSLPRFASLSDATISTPEKRSLLARFFLAPFADVDERVARLAAANRAEREAREASMFAADEPRRS